jgi:hypothetical protein
VGHFVFSESFAARLHFVGVFALRFVLWLLPSFASRDIERRRCDGDRRE